jgi:Glycoside Hydrolase Family 113
MKIPAAPGMGTVRFADFKPHTTHPLRMNPFRAATSPNHRAVDTVAGMVKALAYVSSVTFLLSLLGAALADRATPAEQPHAVPPPTTQPQPPPTQLIGAALNLYHTDRLDLYHGALEQMSRLGFNAVQIVTPIFQVDGAAARVGLEPGPDRGPSMEDIASLLGHAKRLGMKTMLMPQVNFTDPRGNEWRGKLQPAQWGPWWDSYTETIDRFLDTAIENNVDVFVVGCELLTTHKPEHEARWRQLIKRCRARFPGKLTYSTTWDTYYKVTFWDALDAVGVSGYWDITTLAQDPDHPTPDELKRRWVQIKQRLLAFADAQGKPVLLTEVGYPSLPWALKDPWNYINSDDTPPDHDAQAAGYAAFIAAWADTIKPPAPGIPGSPGIPGAPGLPATVAATTGDATTGAANGDPRSLGVFFHKWDPYHRGGPDDTGYGIAGKPAYQLLADWLRLSAPGVTPTDR